jgi:glycosyltransferase involved in cell wall biosynthesis
MRPAARLKAFVQYALQASVRARTLGGDVVLATSTPLTIAIPAIFATVGRSTPFVMEVRDLWPSVPIAMGYLRSPLVKFLARSLEKVAYRRASKVIALSQGMAEGVTAVGFEPERISVIPNLSDVERFRHADVDPSAFYKKYPQLNNRRFVVYTGTFGHVNGVEYMATLAMEYAAYDPDLAFVAIGEGARKKFVSEYASELGVLDVNFFLLDAVPKRDLPTILSASQASSSWIIPVKELEANSANKLFDAFAAGRPMLINHGGWQEELLTASGAGLSLDPSDPAVSAKKLFDHLSDEAWIDSAKRASERLGSTRFEAENLYRQFKHVLESA